LSRLAPLDKTLVLILVPLWVLCFALAVRMQLAGGGYANIGLSVAGADSYPVLNGDFSPEYPSNPLEEAGLSAGDLLVRAGGADLRGIGNLAFLAIVREEAGRDLDVPVVYERDGERRETSLGLMPISLYLPMLGLSFSFAASALFLRLRARTTRSVRAYFVAALSVAIAACFFDPAYANAMILPVASGLYLPLLLRFAQVFPDDVAPEGRWHRIWPWLFAVLGLSTVLFFAGRYTLAIVGMAGTLVLGLATVLAVSTRKYRRLDPVARRQMKWVLFGAYCAMLPTVIVLAITVFEPRFVPLFYPSAWAWPLFPAALVVSVVRFNLFDVDRLLSAAASYNVVLVVLGAGALVVVPRAAEAASGLLGIDPGTGQVALSLLLAGIVIPAHRRLRPQIDRLFFKDRYALDHGIAELLPTLSTCADARELTERVGEGLNRLLRPEGCVVYALIGESYVPVFVEGRAVPPAFGAATQLVGALRERRTPLALGDAGRRPDEARLGPFDRAAVETLQAEVVVPVRRDEALAAFICLGPKRSGDVYTSTDISHLASSAEAVSLQLQRFDQEDVIREGREMQDSLRRYVPGAIAEQLSSGAELASGEREVTVLFVDLRGYTSFSESRPAEEIFSTVNRYTETVSQIVQKHTGSVVEFNGDGMMAVFGAPRELVHKERAAVEAGREIVEAVGSMPVDDAHGGQTKLSVGVGIATGEAFVGNIQAVDRMIWSAIGNTTNLAARLQSLTRELDASLVTDGGTWERARHAAADFEKRPDVPIRGRRETQDVYVLPMQRIRSGQ
jgi:class 3 adenylate cyclase